GVWGCCPTKPFPNFLGKLQVVVQDMPLKRKKEIMIIQRIFSYYRKPVFDSLSKKENIIVLHSKNDSGIKQLNADYSKEIFCFNFSKKETNVFLITFYLILKYRPKIIIHEFAIGIMSLPFVFLITKILRIKLILWSHGYDRKKGFNPKKSLADKLRLFYLKKADAILLYGKEDKKLLSRYVDNNKIFVAQNTFDTTTLLDIKKKFELEGRENIKKRIGFKYKYNLIFIGRLLKSKYPELLIDIYEKIKDKLNNNLAIHFIGDGEKLKDIKRYVEQNNYTDNIFFHGSIYDDIKTGELLFCSDMMILPGALGLSVNHSFCFGCPVVSFKRGENGPFHGPEVEYVINGNTGFLAKNYDIDDMTKIIYNYLVNKDLQKKIKKNIYELITKTCSLENMVDSIVKCIDYCRNSFIRLRT
ncbi:MAG: glycosyltransferase family 4 protein, partial [Spirochaetes bacterium]|nr:glycosyltransferase family 4 protein [Spirochaetota bacterium]